MTIVEKIDKTKELVREFRELMLQVLVLICVFKMIGTGLGLF